VDDVKTFEKEGLGTGGSSVECQASNEQDQVACLENASKLCKSCGSTCIMNSY
jgi:hypothetical protein